MNEKMLDYFLAQIVEKVDEHADAFIKRLEVDRQRDHLKSEFIEEVYLKPLSQQLNYLIEKAIHFCQ